MYDLSRAGHEKQSSRNKPTFPLFLSDRGRKVRSTRESTREEIGKDLKRRLSLKIFPNSSFLSLSLSLFFNFARGTVSHFIEDN